MTITLKELLAFNQQIVGLRRAGSSVHLGLPYRAATLEADLNRITSEFSNLTSDQNATSDQDPAGQGRQAGTLEGRLLTGQSLPQPYQQTVEAGIREGRLPAAFECITESASVADVVRQNVWVQAAYPLLVIALAFILMGFLAVNVLYRFGETLHAMRIPSSDANANVATFVSSFGWSWALVPLVVILLYVTCRWLVNLLQRHEPFRPIARWIPGFRRLDRDLRLASFSETLLRLRQKGVPRTEAMSLAAATSGHPFFLEVETQRSSNRIPPLLRWALYRQEDRSDDGSTEDFELESLAFAAEVYRVRARESSRLLSGPLPFFVCIAVSGIAVLAYALVMWIPFCNLINELSNAQNLTGRY